jgi:hypothetical protein
MRFTIGYAARGSRPLLAAALADLAHQARSIAVAERVYGGPPDVET